MRAFSSMIGETLFSEVTMNDKGDRGPLDVKNLDRLSKQGLDNMM